MEDFTKIIQPYNGKTYGGRSFKAYVEIEYTNGNLSLQGVEGPLPSGACLGSCGQIGMHFNLDNYTPAKGWDKASILQLMEIWKLYHLNDMRAECEHQRLNGITYESDPQNVCPICGYKIGSAWKFQPVPEEILSILTSYPEAETRPAWV